MGLIQHPDGTDGFDHRRAGLDHFGLQVPSLEDLQGWIAHLDELGVPHSGVVHALYADVVNFRDPDGIALELSVANDGFWTDLITKKLAT